MSIKELQSDVEEITKILETAQRVRVRQSLLRTKDEIEREIVTIEMKQRFIAESKAKASADADATGGDAKRYRVDLTEYAWDQSDKFVKLFITLKDVQNCGEGNVSLDLQEKSMQLYVRDLNGKDYSLIVNNLLEAIDVEGSYRKIKSDMVAVYLKKATPSVNWSHLTTILQRATQKQQLERKKDAENPEAALVNIMKKMYNEGDSETKKMIAKAWTESQEKARFGQPDELHM